MKSRLFAAAIAAIALTACSQPKAQADPTLSAAGEIIFRAAIRHGVADYVGKHGPQSALRAKALIDDLLVVVSGDSDTTIGALKALAYSKIPAEFSPIDQQDARDVIDLVALAIQQRVGEGALNSEAIVKLRDVLGVIAQAAATAYYAPPG